MSIGGTDHRRREGWFASAVIGRADHRRREGPFRSAVIGRADHRRRETAFASAFIGATDKPVVRGRLADIARLHVVQTLRNRAADIGRARANELERRIGTELRIARVTRGYSQSQVAHRAGVSQSVISEVELGKTHAAVDVLARVAAACDHELAMKLYPKAGSGLRDTPQLKAAEHIIGQAHPIWHPSTEVPVGDAQGRAADLVFEHPEEVAHMEIELTLVDFQAQFRPAQLKRQALAARYERPVRLVFVLRDSEVVRERLAPHAEFIRRVLPVSSREIWRGLRNATPIGGDGILFVRQSSGRLRSR